jgi:hypothetical protein
VRSAKRQRARHIDSSLEPLKAGLGWSSRVGRSVCGLDGRARELISKI